MAQYAYTFTSGDTVTPTKLNNARTVSNIVNADVSASAAIAGTKIAPDFGSQNVVTTGTLSAGAATCATLALTTGSNPMLVSNSSEPYIEVRDTTATTRSFLQAANGIAAVGTISNHPFRFLTNNTERMRIAASGNVGIGTTAPVGPLHVVGSFYLQNSSTPANVSNINDGGGLVLTSGNNNPMYMFTGESERMRITASGNVGIGTTSPNAAARLDVASTTQGFLPPRMTTAQRDAISTPPAGLIIYNTSTNKLNVRTASSWEAVTSA